MMKTKLISCATCVLAMCIGNQALADGLSPEEEQARWESRQTIGHFEVVRMNSLINDFKAGIIEAIDFAIELMEDDPLIVNALMEYHGAANDCFLIDLLFAETNGIIGYTEAGDPIYFETQQYLDQSGFVLPNYSKEYNTAVRANKILQGAYSAWQADACPLFPLNNKCCKTAAQVSCIPSTGDRCKMDVEGNWCLNGSTACPPPS